MNDILVNPRQHIGLYSVSTMIQASSRAAVKYSSNSLRIQTSAVIRFKILSRVIEVAKLDVAGANGETHLQVGERMKRYFPANICFIPNLRQIGTFSATGP